MNIVSKTGCCCLDNFWLRGDWGWLWPPGLALPDYTLDVIRYISRMALII